jgi:GrpB-like predicted nucleotidyltransferase (UPF0157 family)
MVGDPTSVGLGLGYDEIRLERTTDAWLVVGTELRDQVAEILRGVAADVELVGSSSVLGLLAKPIIDLAVGLAAGQVFPPVAAKLKAAGWIYRGDAGGDGGQVFVLEVRPWYRVAHLHVVEHDGSQWTNYVRFRDLLRRSTVARERYEAVKLRLAEQDRVDRKAYTVGKSQVVSSLLSSST